ncbi:MAG: GlcG/HbpS family heme-binding protein [Roseiflexaceae bacterium]
MYQHTILDHHDAQKAINAILPILESRGAKGVIAVADAHGELIALIRMAGAPLQSVTIATNKAFSAARACKPTRDIGRKVRSADQGFDIAYYGDPRFIGWGGGMPVIHNGTCIGAVAVSGLTEDEDAELATVGIDAILKG